MAVQFRDYYEILGVDRNASAAEIKKAFRQLARKYHPDVAKSDPEAEARFKEINEAYEVLGDPEKRKKYDTLGPDWEHGSEFTPPPGGGFGGFQTGPDGQHWEYHFGGSTGFSDFFESLFGNRAAGDPFGGFSGFRRGAHPGAAGPMRGGDIESDLLVSLEEVMQGSERLLRLQQPGSADQKTLRVKIPAGVTEGQLIRVSGMGQPGVRGGEAGDLYLRVRLERHPDFQTDGSDLYLDLEVAPWECVLGCTTEIRSLHGKLRLKIPPQTAAGAVLRLQGKGLPRSRERKSFGDLYVVLNVVVPTELSAEERSLWEQLAKTSDFQPRKTP